MSGILVKLLGQGVGQGRSPVARNVKNSITLLLWMAQVGVGLDMASEFVT